MSSAGGRGLIRPASPCTTRPARHRGGPIPFIYLSFAYLALWVRNVLATTGVPHGGSGSTSSGGRALIGLRGAFRELLRVESTLPIRLSLGLVEIPWPGVMSV